MYCNGYGVTSAPANDQGTCRLPKQTSFSKTALVNLLGRQAPASLKINDSHRPARDVAAVAGDAVSGPIYPSMAVLQMLGPGFRA
jgi:hypothetical protein